MPVVLSLTFLTLVAGICLIAASAHQTRTPRELRGDWWAAFEHKFRAYAEGARR